jgi:hypothetical protein
MANRILRSLPRSEKKYGVGFDSATAAPLVGETVEVVQQTVVTDESTTS